VTIFLSPSFCSLPNDRFKTSSKDISPQSTIQCFPVNFQYPVVSLLSSSSCLRRPCRIPVNTKPSIIFLLITCFGRHLLRKKWPIKSAFLPSFLPSFLCYPSPPWLYVTLLYFSRDRFNWSSLSFSSTFQNFPDISALLSEVSKFQQYKKLFFQMSVNKYIYLRF
jgi:hypothetical protein